MGSGCCKSPCCNSTSEDNKKPVPPLPTRPELQSTIPGSIQPPSSLWIESNRTSLTPEKIPPPERIVEDVVIVWLNPSADRNSNTQKAEEQQLQAFVNIVKTYTDSEECRTFIRGIQGEKIILVVSGTTKAEQFAPTVQEAPQIDSIYCLSSEGEESKIQMGSIPGVNGPFPSVESLGEHIKTAAKMCAHNFVKPVVLENDAEKISFMYDQLFREIILTSKEENMEELYEFCENEYRNNEDEMKFIADLRLNYPTTDSIVWYTQEACLYKVLNKALRTREYENLYELRVFIRHLYEEILARLKKTKWESRTLYRGQVMKREDFKRIRDNQGKSTFFPSFLSTTTDREVAMKFAKDSLKRSTDKEKEGVLFEIKVDRNVHFPLVDINDVSVYPGEGEWLFSLGSVFRIDAIKEQPDQIQLIELTLIDYNDEQLETLKEHLRKSVKDENICLSFARLIHQLGKWEGSRKLYLKSLDKKTESYRKAAIYNNLGSIASQREKHDEALKNYKQSLKFEQEKDNFDRNDLALTYNNIGTLYYKKKEMDLAMENFQRAIAAYNNTPNGNYEIIATLYNNIANVLNDQGKHHEALVNNERCAFIRESTLPLIHPSLATAYNNMANTYYYLYHFSQGKEPTSQVKKYAQKAIDYATKAVKIDNQALPSDHPQTKTHTENLERFTREGTNSKQ